MTVTQVYFIPRWPENPYHAELAEHLREFGCEVCEMSELKAVFARLRSRIDGPTVVHVHAIPHFTFRPIDWARALMFFLRLRALQRLGVRVVWTVHDVFHHEAVCRAVDRWISRRLFLRADAIIVHSAAALGSIESHWRTRRASGVSIIPHANFIETYSNRITREEARSRLGIAPGRLVFLFLGLIRPYKGVPDLIDAFLRMPDSDALLIIAGKSATAALDATIREHAGDHPAIRLDLGFVAEEDIQVYMNAADVVVFPYRKTLTSGALLLAMSFGRACIAPRLGAIADTLDSDGGILYDPDMPGALDDALARAVNCRDSLAAMGAHNLDKVRPWTWGRVAGLTAAAYDGCDGKDRPDLLNPPEDSCLQKPSAG